MTPLGTTLAVGNATGTRFTQQFFTGDHAAGYDLHSIGIDLDTNSFSSSETLTLRVYSSNEGGTAQSVLYTLTTPWSAGSEIPTSGTVYFTAPDGATLTDNTEYHLVIQGSGNSISDASIATIGGNGQSGEAEWFIGNAYRQNGTLDPFEDSFKMVIRGSQRTNAAPTVADALVDQTATAGSDFLLPVRGKQLRRRRRRRARVHGDAVGRGRPAVLADLHPVDPNLLGQAGER